MCEAEGAIAGRYRLMAPQLKRRQRRGFGGASAARACGYDEIAAAVQACVLAENMVRNRLRELDLQPLTGGRGRRPQERRLGVEESGPELLAMMRGVVEADTRGGSERVLLRTANSARILAGELAERSHRRRISRRQPHSYLFHSGWHYTIGPSPE